ncbi:hypothetical protein F5Y14DRAFT_328851 [Nemania sp. NC0429]|nr:hypothetical protein F5Y14DRAFT_328851 [Nemania sp. NC0429]
MPEKRAGEQPQEKPAKRQRLRLCARDMHATPEQINEYQAAKAQEARAQAHSNSGYLDGGHLWGCPPQPPTLGELGWYQNGNYHNFVNGNTYAHPNHMVQPYYAPSPSQMQVGPVQQGPNLQGPGQHADLQQIAYQHTRMPQGPMTEGPMLEGPMPQRQSSLAQLHQAQMQQAPMQQGQMAWGSGPQSSMRQGPMQRGPVRRVAARTPPMPTHMDTDCIYSGMFYKQNNSQSDPQSNQQSGMPGAQAGPADITQHIPQRAPYFSQGSGLNRALRPAHVPKDAVGVDIAQMGRRQPSQSSSPVSGDDRAPVVPQPPSAVAPEPVQVQPGQQGQGEGQEQGHEQDELEPEFERAPEESWQQEQRQERHHEEHPAEIPQTNPTINPAAIYIQQDEEHPAEVPQINPTIDPAAIHIQEDEGHPEAGASLTFLDEQDDNELAKIAKHVADRVNRPVANNQQDRGCPTEGMKIEGTGWPAELFGDDPPAAMENEETDFSEFFDEEPAEDSPPVDEHINSEGSHREGGDDQRHEEPQEELPNPATADDNHAEGDDQQQEEPQEGIAIPAAVEDHHAEGENQQQEEPQEALPIPPVFNNEPAALANVTGIPAPAVNGQAPSQAGEVPPAREEYEWPSEQARIPSKCWSRQQGLAECEYRAEGVCIGLPRWKNCGGSALHGEWVVYAMPRAGDSRDVVFKLAAPNAAMWQLGDMPELSLSDVRLNTYFEKMDEADIKKWTLFLLNSGVGKNDTLIRDPNQPIDQGQGSGQ